MLMTHLTYFRQNLFTCHFFGQFLTLLIKVLVDSFVFYSDRNFAASVGFVKRHLFKAVVEEVVFK